MRNRRLNVNNIDEDLETIRLTPKAKPFEEEVEH